MLDVFLRNTSEDINYPVKLYSKFLFIKRRYLDELERITDYYRNRTRAVDNTHPISRLVSVLAPDVTMELISYFKIVDTSAIYMSKQFDFVSRINVGKVHDSVFYGKNSKEIFIYNEQDIDLFDIELEWRERNAIRCILTGDDSMDFYCPIGDKDFEKETLSVYEIDIRLLLLQYKFWAEEQILLDLSTNTNVFIANFVLPNMMGQLLDLNLFNRFNNIIKNKKSTSIRYNHPFHVLDYSNGIDSILLELYKDYNNTEVFVDQLFKVIPTFVNTDMNKAIEINVPFYNRQMLWSLLIARVDIIFNLLIFLGTRGRQLNLERINKLPILIKELKSGSTVINNVLNKNMKKNFYNTLKDITKIVGTR